MLIDVLKIIKYRFRFYLYFNFYFVSVVSVLAFV